MIQASRGAGAHEGGERWVSHTEWQGYGITVDQGVRRHQCSARDVEQPEPGHTAGELIMFLLCGCYVHAAPLGRAAFYLDWTTIRMDNLGRTNKHTRHICFSPTNQIIEPWLFYLRRWGQERFYVYIGVVHFQVMVSQSSGHSNSCHNPSLEIKKSNAIKSC